MCVVDIFFCVDAIGSKNCRLNIWVCRFSIRLGSIE